MFAGVHVPGANSIAQMSADLKLPADLTGKRVLDIGAWNGCFSFECERRGAREVIALGPENPEVSGFNRISRAIGSKRTRYVLGSIYNLDPQTLGYFDIVLCCGVLYHLRYPLLGIDNIRRVCKGDVFVETYLQHPLCKTGLFLIRCLRKLRLGSLAKLVNYPAALPIPLWRFYRLDEVNGDHSNWFGPNVPAVIEAFESAGFATTLLRNRIGRATFHGKAKPGVPEFLNIASVEAVFYDVTVGHLFGNDRLGLSAKAQPGRQNDLANPVFDRAA
jgi:tRNA (mo5U34)-methyltransferase